MHSSKRQTFHNEEPTQQATTIICLWRTNSPHLPIRMILPGIPITEKCVCILKDNTIVTAKEGAICLWDVKASLCSSLESQLMQVAKQYHIGDEVESGKTCALICLAKVSYTVLASLDSRGNIDLW